MKIMRIRRGFTLVELVLVMAILLIMAVIMMGIFNAIGQTNKARDARRKKDLGRIKVAFEEYFNDKGCYPDPVAYGLTDMNNCGKAVFGPWLIPWPCDPRGTVYYIVTESGGCPKWFKVMAQLENLSDTEIPVGWSQKGSGYTLGGTVNASQVNYGVSSTNVNWLSRVFPGYCVGRGARGCYTIRDPRIGCDASGSYCDNGRCWFDGRCSWDESRQVYDTACMVDCCCRGDFCREGATEEERCPPP